MPTIYISDSNIDFITPLLNKGIYSLSITYNKIQFSEPIVFYITDYEYNKLSTEQGSMLGGNNLSIYIENEELFEIPENQIKLKFVSAEQENIVDAKYCVIKSRLNIESKSIDCVVPFLCNLPGNNLLMNRNPD